MTSQVVRTLVAIGLSACGVSTRAAAQDVPPRVDVIGINGTTATAEYVLTNEGLKPATAWAVEFVKTDSSGSKVRSGETTDDYITIAHPLLDPALQSRVFEPGASRRLKVHIGTSPGSTPVSLEARVVAAVFVDGSSIGDAAQIDSIFASRQAQRDTYAALLAELRNARSRGGRPEDLEALLIKVEAARDTYPAPSVAQTLILNLKGRNVDLEVLERHMSVNREVAERHSDRH